MYFDIKINRLEGVPEQLKNDYLAMRQIEEKLKEIRTNLIGQMDGFEDIGEQLNSTIEEVKGEITSISSMWAGFIRVLENYKRYETMLINQSNIIATGESKWSKEEKDQYEAYKKKVDELYNKLRFTPEDLAEILKCTKVKDLNELFELLRTGKLEGYIDLDKVEGLKEKLELWQALLGKAHLMNPSDCTLTKEEKVAILMAIKPIADKMDDAYDKLEVEHPFIKNVFGDLDEMLNTDIANNIEEKGFSVLSINGCMQNLLGFNYRAKGDSYYTQEGSLQNQWGFCDYMDDIGNVLGMNLDTEITTFNYDGQEFRVQLWKGNYGWGAAVGGEFGLYSRPEWEAKGNPYVQGTPESELILYDCVDEKYQLLVKQQTSYIDKKGIKKSLNNNTASYGDGTHYWNLNIRTEAGVENQTIATKYEIDCTGKDVAFQEVLYKSLVSNSNIKVAQEGSIITVAY